MYNDGRNRPAQCRNGKPEGSALLHTVLCENAARAPSQASRLTPNAFQNERK